MSVKADEKQNTQHRRSEMNLNRCSLGKERGRMEERERLNLMWYNTSSSDLNINSDLFYTMGLYDIFSITSAEIPKTTLKGFRSLYK